MVSTMAKDDAVREVLKDMEAFLRNGLQGVVLPSNSQNTADRLLVAVQQIQHQHPELAPVPSCLVPPLTEPASPPPYLDMKGGTKYMSNTTDYVYTDSPQFQYDFCDNPGATETQDTGSRAPHAATTTLEQEECIYEGDRMTIVAAVDLNNVMKSGFLEKKGKGLFNTYQKRWCALKDGAMYYYSRPTDKRQCGNISLAGYEARSVLSSRDAGNKKDGCFELVCPGKRTFQFMASSANEMLEWISAIENVVRGKNVPVQLPPATGGGQAHNTASTTYVGETKTKSLPVIDDDIYETLEDTSPSNTLTNGHAAPEPDSHYDDTDNNDASELYDDADGVQQGLKNLPAIVEIEDPDDWYLGVWDCNPDEVGELQFKRGDLIRIIARESYSWWLAELAGKTGYVPKNYLTEAYEVLNQEATCC